MVVRVRLFPQMMLLALPALLLTASAHAAKSTELTVQEIVDKSLGKGAVGFKQGAATLQMTMISAKGEQRSRTLEMKAMRGSDGLLRSIVRFTKPAEVNGISFLVHEKKDALPDQYVYVPSVKVVRRVAAGNATSSFFGSDFTFGDLMPLPKNQLDKVGMQKLPDGSVGDQPVYVVEVTPKIEGSPYGRVVTHVHKQHFVPLKIEFFDPANKPLKVLKVKKLKKVEGELVPVEVEMKAAAGSSTLLSIEAIDANAKLSEADFTEEAMQR